MVAESSRVESEPSNAGLKGPLSCSITTGTKDRGGFINKHYEVQKVTQTEDPEEQNQSKLS